ncbi:hypothetical protein [Histophilus somni]|uniref:hypothetical protein n=1 Tax=Histophilus somni TaxID=731 RepID=UPI00201ED154|nr:hypothetical protein [Histophilus somni]
MQHTLDDRNRRLHNTNAIGTVEAIDWQNYKLKIRRGNIVSKWLDWPAVQTNNMRYNPTLKEGQQLVLSLPSGDLNNACVVGGLWRPKHHAEFSPPDVPEADRPTTELLHFADGTQIRYDAQKQEISLTTGFKVVLNVDNEVNINARRLNTQAENTKLSGDKMNVNMADIQLTANKLAVNVPQINIHCDSGLTISSGANIIFNCSSFIVNGKVLA